MSKPEDIPQDVWDAADDWSGWPLWADLNAQDQETIHAGVARAIMAAKAEEREAAIKTCDDEIEQAKKFGPHHVPIIVSIRAAIRNRGTP